MRAFTFLHGAGEAGLGDVRWPRPAAAGPGPWVTAGAGHDAPTRVEACRRVDLSWWLADELWEVELDGDVTAAGRRVVARRGRLVRRVAGWRYDVSPALAADAAWRTRGRAVVALEEACHGRLAALLAGTGALDELAVVAVEVAAEADESTPAGTAAALAADAAASALGGRPDEAPFVAACAAGHERVRRGGDAGAFEAAFAGERAHQSAWLATRLGLR